MATGNTTETGTGNTTRNGGAAVALQSIADMLGYKLEDVASVLASDPALMEWAESHSLSYRTFTPRPDRPEQFDQQAGFVNAKDKVSFLIAGNGSGKTEAAAAKCAKFVLRDQPPPRRNTPFWILSDTMEIVTSVCWCEKLLGNGHIPPSEIEWDLISWHDMKQNQPKRVPLKPWPTKRGGDRRNNWCLEFKSYEQGRQAMQARSIGGFWFSEQFPVNLFTEALVRCRDYLFRGGQFCEFTPLEPDLCLWVEKLMDDPPNGWGFYRANTECNAPNLAEGAIDAFMATVSDEMKETRLRGALATFEGAIFTKFNPVLHIVPDEDLMTLPDGCFHAMGTDWGASEEHPFVVILAAVDGVGTWWVYDEYWSVDQNRTTLEHAKAVAKWAGQWGWPIVEKWNESANQRLWMIRPDAYHGVNYADPSRPGNINEFSTYGVPTGPAVNDVYTGIDELRTLLKINPVTGLPSLRIAKRCKHLIEEMRKYRWRRGRKPTDGVQLNPVVPRAEPLKRDDDTVDALRYAIVTTLRNRRTGAATVGPKRAEPQSPLVRTSATRLPSGLCPIGKR